MHSPVVSDHLMTTTIEGGLGASDESDESDGPDLLMVEGRTGKFSEIC